MRPQPARSAPASSRYSASGNSWRSATTWTQTWSAPASWWAWTAEVSASGVAPGDHGVDQPVAPAPADVVVAVAEGAQVLRVVGQAEVGAGVAPGQLPRPDGVRLEDDGHLGGQERAGAEDGAGPSGVLDRDEVGMGAGGAGRRQLEHPGPEGGQHAALGGHRRGQGVEGIEVGDHLRVRARVVGHRRAVAGADAEEEAPAEGFLQGGDGRPDVLGRPRPDADDAAGYRDVTRRREQALEVRRQAGVEAAGRPQRPVAQLFELGATLRDGSSGSRHEPLHHTPTRPRSMAAPYRGASAPSQSRCSRHLTLTRGGRAGGRRRGRPAALACALALAARR